MAITVMEAPAGFWRAKTVAQILKVSTSTVQGWIRDQKMEGKKVFGVYLVPDAELKRFVEVYTKNHVPLSWIERVLRDIFPKGLQLTLEDD